RKLQWKVNGAGPTGELTDFLSGRRVPQNDGSVPISRGDGLAVRGAADRQHCCFEARHLPDRLARRRIPDAHGFVETARKKPFAVGGKGESPNFLRVSSTRA